MTRAVVFAYSEVGVRCVRELLSQGVEIPLLFTHADDPAESQWFGSVRELGLEHGLRVETPEDPNQPGWVAEGRRADPDFLFSFYYRYLLKAPWLGVPRRGALNMHGSLLPKYRGRAPVHWAIIHGETSTGASLHYMLEKPDAGALVDQQSVAILENDTALEVSEKVAQAAAQVLRRSLPKLIADTAQPQPLDLARGSYFGRRRPEDGRIDWRQGARAVHDLVRAVAPPFPGAFTEVNGCRLAILETRLDDRPARYPAKAPCLYAADGAWYADCVDGRRLKIVRLVMGDAPVAPDAAPPPLSTQPLALT
ncbi:MAG: methionyl-tRNA formyltransferase [Gammaproteobacteria bacterium]|nr:methionyl-tRNA formyltransferase [Gammaproteobacteria bacterium]